MKTPLLLFAMSVILLGAAFPAQAHKDILPHIYDTQADGERQIAAALQEAQKSNKHILLDFGANWCPWCHWLHELFETNTEVHQKLTRDFIVVMIDVNEGRNEVVNKRYGEPTTNGLPVLVVLDSTGKQLVTQESGALEKGKGHDPVKVLAFLNKW